MILLSENGRLSCSKKTWNLNVQYFFVTDKIQKVEVKVAYCLIENMLADFFTKPLQGLAFGKVWDIIVNLPSNKNGWSTQKCIGRKEKMTGLKVTEIRQILTAMSKRRKSKKGKQEKENQPEN